MWYCIYIYNGPKPPQLETCKILKQVSVSAGVVYHFFFNHINYIHIPLMLHQCKNHAILTAFIFSTTSIVLAFQTEQTFLWNVWLLLFIYNKCPCFDMLWYLMQRHAVPFQRNLRCVRVVMLWEHLCMFVSWSMCEISRRLQLRGPDASGVMPLRAAPSGGSGSHLIIRCLLLLSALRGLFCLPCHPWCIRAQWFPATSVLSVNPKTLRHWLAPSEEGYRGVSSVVLCWSSTSGRRDQIWVAGSLSRPSGSLILILLNSMGSYPQW